jgi:amino acid adenylation domain-containing protein
MTRPSKDLANLSLAEKRELLAQLLEKKSSERSSGIRSLPVVRPMVEDRFEPFLLTPMQQAYWIGRGDLFELGGVGAHYYFEFETARLDVERLTLAWQRLIDRHDMLRAVILPDGRQRVLRDVPAYRIEFSDLSDKPDQVVAEHIGSVRRRMSCQVFPVDRWPLFEISVARLQGERTRLFVSLDLLIVDLRSAQILVEEWFQFYGNPEATLRPMDISFRDYLVAEQTLQTSDVYQRSKEYWFSRLPTLPPAPSLPLAKMPGAVSPPRFTRRIAGLDPVRWSQFKRHAGQLGLTPASALLAAFAEVMTTWSKSPRFCLNMTLFNRLPIHPQVEHLVGEFTSVNILEVDNSNRAPFHVFAERLHTQLCRDLDYRYFHGVNVLRELARTQRETSKAVMPVVFTCDLAHDVKSISETHSWLLPGEIVYGISQTPQVFLDHQVFEQAGALLMNWDAVDELFPQGLLDDMFDANVRLLERLADDENSWHQRAHSLIPPPRLEQRAIVNSTDTAIAEETLHALFAAQAPRRSDSLAVIAAGRRLTYQEIFDLAGEIGRHLQKQGVRPETLVAVVLERGWEEIVAVLGILMSGAAYLPIDPALPQERRWYLLENGAVEWVLTQSHLAERLGWPQGVRRLCIDRVEESGVSEALPPSIDAALATARAGASRADCPPREGDSASGSERRGSLTPNFAAQPDDLAYVIYTSGSTGLPKGVMIEHRAAVNTIEDINRRFDVNPSDRVLVLSGLGFDLSVYDIFGMLAAGGTIVLPDPARWRDPAHWLELIEREHVTIWDSVPALMEMFMEHIAGLGSIRSDLRLVLLSGDWIPVGLPDRIKSRFPGVRVIGLGGATEASIWSILYPIHDVDPDWKSIPYGKPMANQQWHVLDGSLEPAPIWVPGDLYIAGRGLARGYWRDPDKTQAAFIIHPRTGERLYRTGDKGRYLPDGNIEFLGRDDFQVKIRGHRIELGEIEATLQQHPSVRASIVLAVGDTSTQKRLAAFVVAKDRQGSSSGNGSNSTIDRLLWDDAAPPEGILIDPKERLEFKLKKPSLRQNDKGKTWFHLERPQLDEEFLKAYNLRKSYREFQPEPIPFQQFSRFLSCLYQIEVDGAGLSRSRYGSAGGLYPVQVYLSIKPGRVEGMSAGIYYYHPNEHFLVCLSPDAELDRHTHVPTNLKLFDESAFSLFLVGRMSAIRPLYGDRSRDFSMLEAGLMTQLLEESAPASHIGLCQIGMLDFHRIRHLFELEESDLLLHSLAGGRIDPMQARSARAEETSQSALPASVRTSNGEDALISDVRRFLQDKLPAPMVPSTFVLLPQLPLSSNGKVDRKALADAARTLLPSSAAPIPPRNDLERALAAIVQEVLQVDNVSIQDNFFDLGANSLQMVHMHNRLQALLGREISAVELFKYPTIGTLVKHLGDAPEKPAASPSHDRAEARKEALRQRRQIRTARQDPAGE